MDTKINFQAAINANRVVDTHPKLMPECFFKSSGIVFALLEVAL
jgi:hypothetical protein